MKLIIAFTIFKVVFSATHEIAPPERRHIALCLKNIIHQHFHRKSVILVSVPPSHDNTIPNSIQNKNSYLVDFVLQELNSAALWPLHVFRPDIQPPDISNEQPDKHRGYILFTWPTEENDLTETLASQHEALQYSRSWNPRARFVVVVTAYDNSHPHLVALNVSETMWTLNRIVNLIVVIANRDITVTKNRDIDGTEETHLVNIYTWFPYKGGHCAEPAEVVLIAQCLSGSIGQLTTNEPLFPNKIPNNLQGCPIKAAVIDIPPYVILTEKYKQTGGNTVYKFRGLEIEYLLLVNDAMNSTLDFHHIKPDADLGDRLRSGVADLYDGSDVAIGRMSRNSIHFADITIPFIFDAVKWYVPCPKPALRTDKIMGIFTPSVWVTMAVVIILTTLVSWRTCNGPTSAATESHTYRTVLYCAYNAWSAFMGVSVPEMPRTSKLRILFLVFVCYCFAMNTVFQAFFTSFLVAPGYGKKIASLDELKHSDLMYGRQIGMELSLEFLSVNDYKDLTLPRFECADHVACLQRVFTKGDITTMSLKIDAEYVFLKVNGQSGKKMLCTVNKILLILDTVMCLTKGHPLLDRFNAVITRCMETGLVEKYWSELNHNLQLENVDKFKDGDCEVCSEMYFVFSLSHLRVAFLVLGFGYFLSAMVFLFEFLQARF
jgi:hypothetical protein